MDESQLHYNVKTKLIKPLHEKGLQPSTNQNDLNENLMIHWEVGKIKRGKLHHE